MNQAQDNTQHTRSKVVRAFTYSHRAHKRASRQPRRDLNRRHVGQHDVHDAMMRYARARALGVLAFR